MISGIDKKECPELRTLPEMSEIQRYTMEAHISSNNLLDKQDKPSRFLDRIKEKNLKATTSVKHFIGGEDQQALLSTKTVREQEAFLEKLETQRQKDIS